MTRLMRFATAVRRDRAVASWLRDHDSELGRIARHWFREVRACGDDVRELLHDGHPTACVRDAAFAYANVFRAHVDIGFFRGAELADPDGLLEGTGRFMRHVKLRAGGQVDEAALRRLVHAAYLDMKQRLEAE